MVECRNLIGQFFKAFSIANFNYKKVSIIGFSSLWRRFSTHDNFDNRKSILLVTYSFTGFSHLILICDSSLISVR